jgi:hypothetical protein
MKLSDLKPGEEFIFPDAPQTRWMVIAQGHSFAIITDGKETTSELNDTRVIMVSKHF